MIKSKVKKIIIVWAIAIVVLTSGLLYFLNLNNNYKPNGKIEYENVYIKEEQTLIIKLDMLIMFLLEK